MGNEQSTNSSTLAAVILAAGMSRRMGRPKALLDLGGKPLIQHMARTVLAAIPGIDLVIVTGHKPQAIREALSGLPARFVHNSGFEAGEMLSSVKAGVGAVKGKCDALLLCLLDQPAVLVATLRALWSGWQIDRPPLLAPCLRKKHGHPIVISGNCIDEILALPADGSLRDLVSRHRPAMKTVNVDDPGVGSDLDTPEDYEEILKLVQSARADNQNAIGP